MVREGSKWTRDGSMSGVLRPHRRRQHATKSTVKPNMDDAVLKELIKGKELVINVQEKPHDGMEMRMYLQKRKRKEN